LTTFLIWQWLAQSPGVACKPYSEQLLVDSQRANRLIIIDFSADWWSPCRRLDAVTFHHPQVTRQIERHFTLVKVDVTRGGNPLHQHLLNRYNGKGVPTVVFLDGQGQEKNFKQMMPSLGDKYPIEIEVTSKPKADYMTDAYFELDLPVAPAVMVADEIVVEGKNVSRYEVEVSICRHLDLPELEPPKKGLFNRILR
jgi:hypothetical protein